MMLLRTLAVPFLVLGLAVSCGKKTPDGTTPPGETGGSDAAASGGGDGGSGGGGGDAGGGDAGGGDGGGDKAPTDGPDPTKVCDAEVSETPKALFGDNVLIRLPKGVEVVERNEFFAQITSSTTQSTCDAIVSFAAIGYFATDASKPVTQIRDETLKARGLDGDIKWADETTKNRDYSASYELPEGPKGEPPLKGWIAFKEKAGTTFWVAYETHPNAWNAVGKSFQESARRMLITKK